jgi:predicted ATPase/DNA-binding SARP family transcriptional activator
MAHLRLELLGPPLIYLGDEPIQVSSRKPVALLAYLAVTGQPHTRDFLAALLWPDHDQATALAYLRNALWVLGKAGLGEWLSAEPDSVRLQPGCGLDLADFRALAAQGQTHGHPPEQACRTCLHQLRAAADCFRDGFLAGFALRDSPEFDDWQSYQAETLRQELARVLECLVLQCEAFSDPEPGILYARRWVALDPLHEPAQRRLMRMYAHGDRRALALKQYETLTHLLEQELGAEPDAETHRLFREINLGRVAPARAERLQPEPPAAVLSSAGLASRPAGNLAPNNLPAQVTSFIGRQRDIARVLAQFEEDGARLLTITGPGGTGKTRLALQVAGRLVESHAGRYPDGVFFVDLSLIDREDLAPSAIARALGMLEIPGRPLSELLADHLRDRRTFVVLDNFEHVMGAAALLAGLLGTAPGLTVLVTSREVLRLYGEQVYDVQPLELPPLDPAAPLASVLENEAVQLFHQRARAARPAFTLDGENAARVAEICVRLDGLPLAIELAAARAGLLSLDQLLGQLDDRLKALRGGPRNVHARQRTLGDTIDWSYNLLGEGEKRLFARLAVFHGSCCLEAVEQVCAGDLDLDAAEALESLRNKSLLRGEPGPDCEPRFAMLETIRAYTLKKLEETGEAEEIRRRHASYYLALVERAAPELTGGSRQIQWLDRLEREYSDLRAALQWSLDGGDVVLGQRLAGGLLMFWNRHFHYAEWEWWIAQALEHRETAPLDVRARLLFSLGDSTYFLQVPQAGVQPLREAVSLYRKLGDRRNTAWALVVLAIVLGFADPGKYPEALALGEEGLALFRTLDDPAAVAQALNVLGELTRSQGQDQRACQYYEESLAIAIQIGDRLREEMMYENLGFVAYHEGKYALSRDFFLKALALAREIDVKAMTACTLSFLSGPLGALGHPDSGVQLLAASEALERAMAFVHQPADQEEIDRYKADLRARLPDHDFQAAWEAGRALAAQGLDEVLRFALDEAFPH